jgi:hypothetical protein
LAEEVIGPLKAQARGVTEQLEFLTADPRESSSHPVYIVAIGWLYVVIMMAVTETSFMSGAVTLICYGIVPLGLFLWIVGTPQRRRRAASGHAANEKPDQRD